MADNPQKPMKTKESDSAREAGAERTQVRPEVAKSAQVDARGMQEVENTRTNKHSGSASELEWNKGNRGNGDRVSAGDGNGGADGTAGKTGKIGKEGKGGESGKSGGDGDSITIEAVDETGKKFTVASRVSGGTERDFLAKGDKGEGARGAPVERGQKEGEAKELVREDLTASARELGEKPQERFQTRELKAIQADESLPAEKRVLAEQLQQMRSMAKEANQPTDEIDRFATEAFKDDIRKMRGSDADEAGTFQAISDTNLVMGTLPVGARGATDLTKSVATTDATALQVQSQSQARHLDEDGRPIVDHQAEQLDKKTFSLGLSYEEGSPPLQNETMEKMSRFLQAATHRAEAFITNPDAQAKYIEEQKEKFIGIGIGLNDAKEAFKALAGEGWKQLGHGAENLKEGASHLADALSRPADINEAVVKETQAVLKVLAEDPNAVNKALSKGLDDATHAAQPMVDAGGKMLQDMSENPQYLNDALAKGLGIAGNAVLKASNEYSNLPPREKGRVIGLLMFDMINPEGTLEAPALMAQTAKRGTNAAKEIVQVAAGSATVQEAKANLYILEDLVKSDEFKDLLQNGVFEALNIGKQESFAALGPQFDNFNMAMMGDDFFKPITRRWEALTSDLGRIESRFKRYRSDLPSPFEEGLSAQEQHLRAVDWLVERVPEHAEHFDHYSDCRNTLLNHKSREDLLTLCKKDHMILTPDKMEDVAPKLANRRSEVASNLFEDNMPACTVADQGYTVIPKQRVVQLDDQESIAKRVAKEWIENASDKEVDGIVRHELGQSLAHYGKWVENIINEPELHDMYLSARRKLLRSIAESAGAADDNIVDGVVFSEQLKRASLGPQDGSNVLHFYSHVFDADYGLEQVITDLYAIEHGGSNYGKPFDEQLKTHFAELIQGLKSRNWYRK